MLAREKDATHPAAAELPLDGVGVTKGRLQVRAEVRSHEHRLSCLGPGWAVERTFEEALPIGHRLTGEECRQLGSEIGQTRAQLAEPDASLIVRELERPGE